MNDRLGICCPSCNSTRSAVVDSRDSDTGRRRRRSCLSCKERYTTWEMTEATVHSYELRDIDKALSKLQKASDNFYKIVGDFKNVEDGL